MIKKTCLLLLFIFTSINVYAKKPATPQEIFQKVAEASLYLMDAGKDGLKDISRKSRGNPFIWKDTYVFVLDCEKRLFVSHPNPALVNNKNVWQLKDPNGKFIVRNLCKIAKDNENGGWFEYYWTKKQDVRKRNSNRRKRKYYRKISYCLQIPGMTYQVAAGIYENNYSIKDLNKKTKEWIE